MEFVNDACPSVHWWCAFFILVGQLVTDVSYCLTLIRPYRVLKTSKAVVKRFGLKRLKACFDRAKF